MTDALMVAVALGVAAWVLAPLSASIRGAAAVGRQTRPQQGVDRVAAHAGDASTAAQREAGDPGVPTGAAGSVAPGAPGGER